MYSTPKTCVTRTRRECTIRTATGGFALAALLLITGCGSGSASAGAGATSNTPTIASANVAATNDSMPASSTPLQAATGGLAGRTGVLTNPSDSEMVFLYYDLAGVPPPIDQWVAQDERVTGAPGAKKAERRTEVAAELKAGLAAVKGVGVLHLTTRAQISQYDPTYDEFTIGALSPASQYGFQALGRKVTVKLDNGLDAQTWSVPKDQAQAITDKFGDRGLTLDVVLKIVKVLPAPDGGTFVTHVESWTLRDNSSGGTTIAKHKMAG